MARLVCPGCRRRLDASASFCSGCGSPVEGLAVEVIDDIDDAPGGDVEVGSSRRWRAAAVVGVAAVIAAGALVRGGGAGEVGETTPSTTVPEEVATTEPPTTTTTPTETTARSWATYRVDQLGPLLADEAGTVVYGYQADTYELVRIDLATGEMVRRSMRSPRGETAGSDVSVMARAGGAVVSGTWGAVFIPDRDSDGPRRGTRLPVASGEELLAATALDEVWVVTRDGRRAATARRVDTTATPVGPPVELPQNTFLLGDDGTGGLLLAAPGGRYRVSDSGPTERVAPTTVVAWSAGTFVLVQCDEALDCELVVVDRASGRTRSIGPAPPDAVSLDYAALSPDDRFMVRPVPEGIEVTELTTGSTLVVATTVDSEWGPTGSPAAITWSSTGRHLLWIDTSGQLMALPMGGDGAPVTLGPGLLPSLEAMSVASAGR